MPVLVSDVITRVNEKFRYRDPVLPLAASIDNSQTSLTVNDYLPVIGLGNVIKIGNEYMLVTATSGTGPMTLTVIRGWFASTKAAHTQDDPVYQPRVYDGEILDFINECLDSLYPEVYAANNEELSYDGNTIGYELPLDTGFVLKVIAQNDPRAKYWQTLADWTFENDADTSDFSTGKALNLRSAAVHGANFRVIYASPFTRLTLVTEDLEADAGMDSYMTDLPYYFIMSRLMAQEEAEQTDASGAERHQRAQDVESYVALRTGDWYRARYNDKLNRVKLRQAKEYPTYSLGGYGGNG